MKSLLRITYVIIVWLEIVRVEIVVSRICMGGKFSRRGKSGLKLSVVGALKVGKDGQGPRMAFVRVLYIYLPK